MLLNNGLLGGGCRRPKAASAKPERGDKTKIRTVDRRAEAVQLLTRMSARPLSGPSRRFSLTVGAALLGLVALSLTGIWIYVFFNIIPYIFEGQPSAG